MDDNTFVHRGDLMLRIFQGDYINARDQARANLDLARAQLQSAENGEAIEILLRHFDGVICVIATDAMLGAILAKFGFEGLSDFVPLDIGLAGFQFALKLVELGRFFRREIALL